jgi:hypothetical protein
MLSDTKPKKPNVLRQKGSLLSTSIAKKADLSREHSVSSDSLKDLTMAKESSATFDVIDEVIENQINQNYTTRTPIASNFAQFTSH